ASGNPREAAWHVRFSISPADFAEGHAAGVAGTQPKPVERRIAGIEDAHRVALAIRDHGRRRDRTDPAFRALPRPTRRWIIHAHRAIVFADPSAAVSKLPFQGVACQRFSFGSL